MHADHQPPGAARAVHPATPPRRRGLRHAAGLAGLGLLAAAVPVVGLSAPAVAAVECTSEEVGDTPILGPLLEPACDDVTPPETTIGAVAPAPNAAGWLRQRSVSIAFTGAYQAIDDTDTDPITFECKLDGPSKAHDWRPCTSPTSYTDLTDSPRNASYVFQVRAVDSADAALTVTPTALGQGVSEAEPADQDDDDNTPATTSFRIDTVNPVAVILGRPADPLSPDRPVLWSRQATLTIRSNEADATMRCTVDGAARACNAGQTVIRDLTSGPHLVTVGATDPAGNTSPDVSTSFEVGDDLTLDGVRRVGWKVVEGDGAGAFSRDVVRASRVGALLQVPDKGAVRELRLHAPISSVGRVRVRVGAGAWHIVDLSGREPGDEQIYVRRAFQRALPGAILIEALSKGVVLDGVYAR